MWHRLCALRGIASVRQAQAEISSREFAEILALEQIDTLQPDAWHQTALLCSMVANACGVKSSPRDFLPVDQPGQTPEQMAAEIRSWVARQKARNNGSFRDAHSYPDREHSRPRARP